MNFSAYIQNSKANHQVMLKVGDKEHTISIAPRETGGSSVSGGELLFLAIATCFCNDIYREAGKRGIKVESVEVEVDGDFQAEGKPATNVVYRAKVKADASEDTVRDLMRHTDTVAEIHNSLRVQTTVQLRI